MDLDTYSAKIECSELKKCGEIATLLSSEKSEFFLNCGFCDYTFLQLENFIRHMCEDHILELSGSELKQEEIDMQEFLDEDEAVLHSVDAAEKNHSSGYVLNDFEKVEIELEAAELDSSLDIKEDISQEFVIEEIQEPNNAYSSKQVSETKLFPEITRNKQHERNKKYELYQTQHTKKHEEPDDYEFLIDEPKKDSETTHNEQHTHRRKCDLDETELTNNYDGDDDAYLEDDDVESSSKNDTQGKSMSKTKNVTTAPEIILDDPQCLVLVKIYNAYSCLWNEKDIAYRFKNRREEALRSIQKEFNKKSGLKLTQLDLESEIARLRKSCSNEKKQKLKCKRNKLKYQPTCSYYNDIAFLEVDVPPFECSECGKLMPSLGQLKVHLASHDGSLPFKCYLCGHGFQVAANLTVHLRRHVQDYTYKCEVCDKLCATSTERKIHMRSHTGEKPYVCSICGQRHGTSSQLLVHNLRHQNRRRHKCKICSKTFFETGTLNEHMKVHTKVRDIICNVCNKGFKSKKHLQQHKLIHNVEKKYLCKICGKRFAQSAGLSGHMKTHGTKLSASIPE